MLLEPIACHHDVQKSVSHQTKTAVVNLADVLIRASGFGFTSDEFVPRIQPAAWKQLNMTEQLLAEIVTELEEKLIEVKNFSLDIQHHMTISHRITLIARDREIASRVAIRLQSKGYQVITLIDLASIMGLFLYKPAGRYHCRPIRPGSGVLALIKNLRADSYFSTIPVIGLVTTNCTELFDWENNFLDDFLSLPINYPELFTRINLSIYRICRIFDDNPLTRLPGDTSIQQAIVKALAEPMAICMNNFEPYNACMASPMAMKCSECWPGSSSMPSKNQVADSPDTSVATTLSLSCRLIMSNQSAVLSSTISPPSFPISLTNRINRKAITWV
jgi:hypothetical protein